MRSSIAAGDRNADGALDQAEFVTAAAQDTLLQEKSWEAMHKLERTTYRPALLTQQAGYQEEQRHAEALESHAVALAEESEKMNSLAASILRDAAASKAHAAAARAEAFHETAREDPKIFEGAIGPERGGHWRPPQYSYP